MNIFHSTNPVNILFLDIDEVLNCNFNKEQYVLKDSSILLLHKFEFSSI